MTVNGIDYITTYGLKLTNVTGHLDQPARKKILKEQQYGAADIVFNARTITVTLIKKFASRAAIGTFINNTMTLVYTLNPTHSVEITEHNIPEFTAVVRKGITVKTTGLVAEITIPFEEVV